MKLSFCALAFYYQIAGPTAGFAFQRPLSGHRATSIATFLQGEENQPEIYHLYIPDDEEVLTNERKPRNGFVKPTTSEVYHLYLPDGDVEMDNKQQTQTFIDKDVSTLKGIPFEELLTDESDALDAFTVTHSINHVVEKNGPVAKSMAIKHLYRYFTDICVDCWLSTVEPEAFLLSCNYTKSDIVDMQKNFPRILSLDVKSHLSPHVRFQVRTLGGGQGDICSGEECSIDVIDDTFIPHNCKVSDLAKRAVPPLFFGRRLEKTIGPRHAYLLYYGLPHGKELLENNGHLFAEFLEACDTPASNFANLCNRWSIRRRTSGAPTYEALHTTETVEAFERVFHRGLLAAASNKRCPELDLLGCTPGKMVDLLLQHGANAIEHDRFGASYLHWAGGTGNLQGTRALLKFLVEAGEGADVGEVLFYTQGAKDGATPLHWAACGVENGRFGVGGHANICRLFLEEAGDRATELADVECYSGSTPLMWAAWSGSLDVVRLLISHGADPHKKNRNECNVAHWATAGGNLEVCKYLHDELGASFEEESIKCRKPLSHAVSSGHHNVAEWLASLSHEDWREGNWQISPGVENGTVPNLQ